MKTTLNIDDRLIAEAKALAAREHSSVTRLIEEGLALRLRKGARNGRKVRRELPVYAGRGGVAAGIDPASNRSLRDAADAP
jgi:hypothetical protein